MATLEVEERIPHSAEDVKRVYTYPLIKQCDMYEDMKAEVTELCVTGCEKFPTDNEAAARFVKENVDKKFGSAWHVLIGEDFGFEITHEVNNLLYMFSGGNLAILVWKCS
ncbi:dynein light chain type 1 [Opisthorchis viverrini]|uniref:Dynein light chain type 1 n=3 Tax=Opisthorchis viverrini TaxID=6198 RepID=A0A1S8X6M5_OPIVI|nr:hypothetical protein T265_07967 [Opisthorchis viverrini]KER24325.1 hypothetical protein T265_07967 [Opisthorchis viverrini]OON22317.1 dynein light chain type 1 [Opisthorchis viverrini]